MSISTTITVAIENRPPPLINPTAALILLIATGLVAILLNGFAIHVFFSQRKHKRISNIPMIWILVANILIGSFPLPVYGLKKYGFEDPQVASHVCDAWRYTYFSTIHLAMSSLLLMTVQKILILTFPLRYQQILTARRTNLVYATAWIVLLFFDLIPFFPVSEYDREFCHYKIKKDWAVAMNILTMAIPLPIIIGCYCYMVYLAFVQYVRIQKTSTFSAKPRSKTRLWSEVKATRKVALITGAYIVCWTPSTLYYLLNWLCPSCFPENFEPHKTWIQFFFKLGVMFHAIITPIIFCLQSNEFRKDARKSVISLGRWNYGFQESTTTTTATTTIMTTHDHHNKRMNHSDSNCSPNNNIGEEVITDKQQSMELA